MTISDEEHERFCALNQQLNGDEFWPVVVTHSFTLAEREEQYAMVDEMRADPELAEIVSALSMIPNRSSSAADLLTAARACRG